MIAGTVDHDLNVVGALVVALGDRMRDAVEDAAGMRGAFPAALVALHEWAGGRTIDTLAGGLRLSHSRTVRVIDRLEAAGLAARDARPASTAAACWCDLTPAGRAPGSACSTRARPRWRRALQSLGRDERRELAAIAERLLADATGSRRAAGAICRLCDAHACGHHEGRCPVTRAADAAEAR